MARAKATKQTKAAETPVVATQPPRNPVWRDFIVVLLLLLGVAASIYIWMNEPALPRLGEYLMYIIWIVTLLGVLGRLQARQTVLDLKALVAKNEIVQARLEPNITEDQSGLAMRHVSAWLAGGLGVAATLVIWQTDAIERAIGGVSTLVVGITLSIMFALTVAANSINRLKTKRLMRDFRAAIHSQRLALDTLGSLDVMISACLPTGERTRFNECFLQFVGRPTAQLQGHGWLEIVHPDDRQEALDLVGKPLSVQKRPRRQDICIRHRDGDYVWLRETLVPRLNAQGELIEFICTAVNITPQIESEAALDKQIGELKNDLNSVNTELAEAKSELSKTKASRNRFEKVVEESREEIKKLQEALVKGEATLARARGEAALRLKEVEGEANDRVLAIGAAADRRIAKVEETAEAQVQKLEATVKSTREEQQAVSAENKKLSRAFEKIQDEMNKLRQENGDLREQIARHIKETREAKEEATDAHKNEAQHRAKSDRLTQRCEELEKLLAARQQELTQAQAESQQAMASAQVEVERRLHEVSAEALAAQLRKQLEGMQRMTSELLATAFDGPGRDAAHNTAATVRAMSDLIDHAVSGKKGAAAAPAPPMSRSANATSFDIRRTVQGVCEFISSGSLARGVKIECETTPNVPGLVHGDDIEIRTVLMSLADAALQLVNEGTLTMRLSEDVNTSAHTTLRCELSHNSVRIKPEELEAALATKSNANAMPDAAQEPVAYQAAKALQMIRGLQGQHGYMMPDHGGFSFWFTFTLGRPAASGNLRAALSSLSDMAPAPKTNASRHIPTVVSTEVTPPSYVIDTQPEAAAPTQAEPGVSRQMPRMPQEMLTCNLGDVVELGADSIRVFCSKPPKRNPVVVKLDHDDFDVEIQAELIWAKKLARGKHDVGLKFIGLTLPQQKKILGVAMQHRKVSTMAE